MSPILKSVLSCANEVVAPRINKKLVNKNFVLCAGIVPTFSIEQIISVDLDVRKASDTAFAAVHLRNLTENTADGEFAIEANVVTWSKRFFSPRSS